MRSIRRIVAIVLIPALLLTGCSDTGRQVKTRNQIVARRHGSGFLRAYMLDGTTYELGKWQIDMSTRRVVGIGALVDPEARPRQTATISDFERRPKGSPLSFPVDSVVVFETDDVGAVPSVLLAITIILGVVGAATIAKAVFGSCPTFYVSDGDKPVLQAEGFSSSIAPSLEATDVDALYRARPAGREVAVTMRNEALETHVVRSVRLLAFPRPPEGRVLAAVDGGYREAFEMTSPTRARAPEGDCASTLAAFDGVERFSAADSFDLAAHETLDLVFERPPAGDLGLVLVSRQGLLATYLFYQSLAYMGRSAGTYLANYERGNAATRAAVDRRVSGISRTLGGIDVWVKDSRGRWTMLKRVKETGPIACDVRLVPLSGPAAGPLEIQLRMARGHWRLDQVALARLGAAVTPLRLEPSAVSRSGIADSAALASLLDSTRTLVTLPGDEYTLAYQLPANGKVYELFLESRGYYLEWLREEWLAEEDSRRAALLLTNPKKALRLLAPEFKRVEPELERQFWSSRYARP